MTNNVAASSLHASHMNLDKITVPRLQPGLGLDGRQHLLFANGWRCSARPRHSNVRDLLLLATACIVLVLLLYSEAAAAQGTFTVIKTNAGISSMHTAVTHLGPVILLDRTDIGPSQIALPDGKCRDNPADLTLKHDCTAHSVMLNPGADDASTSVRPLTVFTDTWCSSGQFLADGTMLQLGGDFDGLFKIRRLVPCVAQGTCDWVEDPSATLQDPRWYSSSVLLPDGRVITVGGRGVFSYEFIPRAAGEGSYYFPFLQNSGSDILYPFVHLLPDGSLYVFANQYSVRMDYKANTVLQTYPAIGDGPRNYPSAGSSVLLPLSYADGFSAAASEVMVCGGAQEGAFNNPGAQLPCLESCGRLQPFATAPAWAKESMPIRRCMGDMLLLPTGDVLIINGAENGSQGWGYASNPALSPVIYKPALAAGNRFSVQAPTTIPRMYHSTANVLPDGRVLLAGSNTHQFYTFTGAFPTELRVEAWTPLYMAARYNNKRPAITSSPATVTFGQRFSVTFRVATPAKGVLEMNLLSSPFSTHSFSQGQRLLRLRVQSRTLVSGAAPYTYTVVVTAPPNGNVAPPSYYMLFPVQAGIAGQAVWVRVVAR